jgi:arginine decarboxylase
MPILGNRIPYEYFVTSGKGESNSGSSNLQYETGSYDAALTDAGIQNANIIEYSSVIPKESRQISKKEGLKRIKWGAVLECIQSKANGEMGSTISSAITVTTVYNPQGVYLGGFACEYSGSQTKKEVETFFEKAVADMIERRGYGIAKGGMQMYKDNITDKGYKIHLGEIFEYQSLEIKQKHGSVLTSICFVSHQYPLLSKKTRKNRLGI